MNGAKAQKWNGKALAVG